VLRPADNRERRATSVVARDICVSLFALLHLRAARPPLEVNRCNCHRWMPQIECAVIRYIQEYLGHE
jgi:hypothetical protein